MPEQSHPAGEVFLSYASQDAEAAARICAALRAAGVVVWLDQSELRGGDAWDAQIKKHIQDCVLFTPVISAHTNARTEGYFRREWKLATRRLLGMADDVAFLVPVVIDDTREANARVPEEFLHVQWTRLPGGETPPAFAHRVRQLLGGDHAAAHNVRPADTGAHEPSGGRARSARSWLAGRGRQRVGRLGVAVMALLLVLGGGAFWYQQAANDAPAAQSASTTDGASAVPQGAPAAAQGSPGASAGAQPSVAVLPFVALSSGPDDGYFADGLTEEIINALTALPDLLVTARTSAFFFKGKEIPVPEIAATLGVAHIVEGSVRRSGDTARITAQLIRAVDGFHLWSETYDQSLGDAFAVQTRIAESVAAALGVLLDERKRAMMADIGVRDVAAFVAYQRGVELFNRAHNEGPLVPLLARANSEFEAAIARKPDFAYAHFQHADYFAHLLVDEAPGQGAEFVSETGVGLEEAAQRLAADFDAAFRYERDAGQRLVVQVVRTTVSDDWRSLGEQIVSAFATWEKCRHGLWIDQTAIVFGYGEAALAHDLRRERCDPLGGNWTRSAITAIWIGRPLDGLAYADRIEALRGQDRDVMHARILAYLALGRLDEAEALYDAGNFRAPDVSEAMSLLALQIPAAAGRIADWERLRTTLDRDPGRLLVGAAVFGDRETANRAAAEIDAMTLGPAILLRITDRCGCGAPFDLDATPHFARLLREGDLPWSPPAPIEFPLKNW